MHRRITILAFLGGVIFLMVTLAFPNMLLDRFSALPLTYLYMLISFGSFLIGALSRKGDPLRATLFLMGGGSAIVAWSLFEKPWPGSPLVTLAGLTLAAFGGLLYLRTVTSGARRE
jgi:hypothetical protein